MGAGRRGPDQAAARARLRAIYREHNPRKLRDVDKLLEEWEGREEVLLHTVETKYLGAAICSIDELFELIDTGRQDLISHEDFERWWQQHQQRNGCPAEEAVDFLQWVRSQRGDTYSLDRAGLQRLLEKMIVAQDAVALVEDVPLQAAAATAAAAASSPLPPPTEREICDWINGTESWPGSLRSVSRDQPISATFTEAGPIGLRLCDGSSSGTTGPWAVVIDEVKADTQAARDHVPPLLEGLVLLSVGDCDVRGMDLVQVQDVVGRHPQRPLTLQFENTYDVANADDDDAASSEQTVEEPVLQVKDIEDEPAMLKPPPQQSEVEFRVTEPEPEPVIDAEIVVDEEEQRRRRQEADAMLDALEAAAAQQDFTMYSSSVQLYEDEARLAQEAARAEVEAEAGRIGDFLHTLLDLVIADRFLEKTGVYLLNNSRPDCEHVFDLCGVVCVCVCVCVVANSRGCGGPSCRSRCAAGSCRPCRCGNPGGTGGASSGAGCEAGGGIQGAGEHPAGDQPGNPPTAPHHTHTFHFISALDSPCGVLRA